MNMGQDTQIQMVEGNGGNQFRQYDGQNVRNQNGYNAVQNVRNQVVQNAVQNPGVQHVGNQNRLIVVPEIANLNANQNGNGNVLVAQAEGIGNGNNKNQVRCYNCRGMCHLARNCTVRPRKGMLLIFRLRDLNEIEEVNTNCILMENFQQASTSGDPDREVSVAETFHKQIDDELTNKEVKQMEADDQSIQTILMGLPDDIYDAVDRQDTQIQMVKGNGGNQFRQYDGQNVRNQNGYNAVQNVRNQVVQNAVQNPGIQHVGNQNRLIVIPEIANLNANQNGNGDLNEIEEVNANCILMENFQQASTSGTQTDKAPVYDSDVSAELHHYKIIIIMIYSICSLKKSSILNMEQSKGTVVQNPTTVEETHALYDSLYHNLAIEVEKVNKIHQISKLSLIVGKKNLKLALLKRKRNMFLGIIGTKKCEECKYDKISYDKAYNDKQKKIERLQAHLGDLKGKSKDTSCASDTLDLFSQKLEDKNVSLKF
nr:hypothetical protein [Tanacetum cinerariifolium]